MKLPIRHVDAFAERLFTGNPAAVVLLDDWLPDELMQAIAAENALSETAFVIVDGPVSRLRWFAPAKEIDLCGHATLATAWVLFRERFPQAAALAFDTRSGRLEVTRRGGAVFAADDLLCLDFPARPPQPVPLTEALCAALGARPVAAWRARDVMAVFDSAAEVRALQPDAARVAALDAYAVIATAPGGAEDDADFVSRFFAPGAGVAEDPVTGSAHCTLVPYWAQRLGKTRLLARQVSRRGGRLECELAGERVLIAGRVVDYLSGEVTVHG